MTNLTRLWLLLFVLTGGVLIAAACGDDGGDDGNGDEPQATSPAEDGDGDGNGDGDALSELEGLAGRLETQEMRVAYDFTSSVDGSSGSFVFYSKPPDRWRVDITTEEGDFSIIGTPEGSYLCTSEDGGSCLLSPALGDNLPVPFLDTFTDPSTLDDFVTGEFGGVDLDRSSDTIAGLDATCYSGSTDEGEGEVCFATDSGIMLRITASDEITGDFSLVATEVATSVSDSDLEPPYPVMEIPGLEDIPGLDDIPEAP